MEPRAGQWTGDLMTKSACIGLFVDAPADLRDRVRTFWVQRSAGGTRVACGCDGGCTARLRRGEGHGLESQPSQVPNHVVGLGPLMPSVLHEALVDLFRQRVTLAPELVRRILRVELPTFTEARVEEAEFNQIVPTEYRADLVVLLLRGKPVYGIVVEVQLDRDADKLKTWPLYATALHAKFNCPVSVLVVTPNDAVARWAARPIVIGAPESVFRALVIGPKAVPWVTSPAEARESPELALLSALAHGNEEGGLDIVLAALASAAGLDETRSALYADLIMASLQEAIAKELENMVLAGKYELQSDFAKKYFAQGEAEGEAKGEAKGRAERAEGEARLLIKMLDSKEGIELTEVLRQRILECTDIDLIERWFERALTATSLDDIFSES